MKRVIDLCLHNDVGIIIACPSGTYYTNQVGGYACARPELEGVFFPLPDSSTDTPRPLLKRLETHFSSSFGVVLKEQADAINDELHTLGLDFVEVDRSKADASMEAWVHVRIRESVQPAYIGLLHGFEGASGILTWPNSD